MALESYLVGYGIDYSDGGAPARLDILSKASPDAGKAFDLLTISAREAGAAILDVGAAASDTTAGLRLYSRSLGASSRASTASAAASDRVAAGFDATAASADAATASVDRYNLSTRGGGGGGGGGRGGIGGAGGAGFAMGGAAGIAAHAAKAGAIAGGVAAIDALFEAGELQQILLSIKNETGSSNSTIGKFSDTAYQIASDNGMSASQGAEVLRTISRLTAGQFSTSKMMAIAPEVAQYASLVHFNRPDISVDDAARVGIQTSHLFRAYTSDTLNPLLDKVYRLSGMMAEKPDQALKQMSYYVPLFKALHVDDSTSLATMALLDRAGFRNKVGSNVRAATLESFGPLQVTAHAQAGKSAILQQMGLLDKSGKFAFNTPSGGVDFFGELGAISKWSASQSQKGVPQSTTVAELTGALGRTGATVAALFLDKQMPGILGNLQKYLHDPNVGLEAAKKNRDTGADFQFITMKNNAQSLMTALGTLALPAATQGFKELGDALHYGYVFLNENKAGVSAFTVALSNDVGLIGSTVREHRQDFLAMGDDVMFIGRTLNTYVLPPLVAFAGELVFLGRILGDFATGKEWDLPAAFHQFDARQEALKIDDLPTHAARVKAWNADIKNGIFDYGDLPDNIARGLRNPPKRGAKAGPWGDLGGPMPMTPSQLFHAALTAAKPISVTNHIDARGMNASEVTAAVAAGTRKGLADAVTSGHKDPRASTTASNHTSAHKPSITSTQH